MLRDFIYCHSITNSESNQFVRIDHFDTKNHSFRDISPTNVVHLSQNKFENILRCNYIASSGLSLNKYSKLYLGYESIKIVQTDKNNYIHIRNLVDDNNEIDIIESPYVIGTDGSNSFIRRQCNIIMEGDESMQSLINVHFRCKGLHKLLKPRPAMLYFVFNEVKYLNVFYYFDFNIGNGIGVNIP